MNSNDSRIRLVVNADGFGMSPARTRGVAVAHARGIVTSTSILGNVDDVAQVKAELDRLPELGTGAFLSLVGGPPVANPDSVRSLLGKDGDDGKFFAHPREVALVWAKAALKLEDIEREFHAQVARLRDHGLSIDHLAAKDDLGFLPVVAQAMENVARKHAIPGLRVAMERPSITWFTHLSRGLLTAGLGAMAWVGRRQLGLRRHGPQTWGMFERGSLDEIRILEILGRLGPGGHELVCQPELEPSADVPPPRSEVAGLTSARVIDALARRGIACCRWADLF